MTRAQMARQIAYYRKLRFSRKRILYEIKRSLGPRWNRKVIAFIDEVIATGGAPINNTTKDRKAALITKLAEKYELRKRGGRWVSTERSADLDALKERAKRLKDSLRRSGFGSMIVRGDVGAWSHQFRYTKARGLELYASLTLLERRKPYRLELELRFA